MGTLYKRPDAGGKKGKWYAAYVDHTGKRVKKSTGTTDKQTASQILNKWETEAAKRTSGLVDADAERYAEMQFKPLSEHLDDFEAKLKAKGSSPQHITDTRKHVEWIAESAKFEKLADIQPEGVEQYVATMVDVHNLSARTCQARIQSIKSFTRWAKRSRRMPNDPLDIVGRPSPEKDRRLERRALSVEEWQRLKTATREGPTREGLAPEVRVLLYETALQTGLRANELRQLTAGRLKLAAAPPYILAKAGTTKDGETAKQYITKDLAKRLKSLAKEVGPGLPLFGMAKHCRTAEMARADLTAAREAWIAEVEDDKRETKRRERSEFLALVNGDGERFDFHALRHSCGTWLATAGVHPKAIQSVMRHSSITLTLDRYGHLIPSMEATAIADMGRMISGADPEELAAEKQSKDAS